MGHIRSIGAKGLSEKMRKKNEFSASHGQTDIKLIRKRIIKTYRNINQAQKKLRKN